MQSQSSDTMQLAADVCSQGPKENVANLAFCGNGASRKTRLPWVFATPPEPRPSSFPPFDEEAAREADLSVARAMLAEMPHAWVNETPITELSHPRTQRLTNRTRSKKFAGWCRWCEASLRVSNTKPRKDCSKACAKQFERHGCTKAVWLLFKEAKRAVREEDRASLARLAALGKAAEGLLCTSPQGRREFDYARSVPCAFPKEEVVSPLGVLTSVPELTPLPEFIAFPVDPAPFIGPLMKNGRSRKRGRA